MSQKMLKRVVRNVTKMVLFSDGEIVEDPICNLSEEEFFELVQIEKQMKSIGYQFKKTEAGILLVQGVNDNLKKITPKKIKENLIIIRNIA